MVDTDGDGFRELPSGDAIVLNMQFSTQGIAGAGGGTRRPELG